MEDDKVKRSGFKPEVHISFAAETRLSSWVGVSIMGALSVGMNKSPVIEVGGDDE